MSAASRRHELGVAVTADGVRVPLSRERAAEVVRSVLRAERVKDALVSVAFLTKPAMARLNREQLGHRGPTDVISFGHAAAGAGGPVIGDIYVCPEVARENAREHGAGAREEIARLLVHGTLHVLGYDHAVDEGRTEGEMWARQERLLAAARAAWAVGSR